MFWRSDIDPAIEPRRVIIKRDVFIDANREGRRVPFKLYHPADATEKLPLVLWSHGLGGSADGASFLARFIASHGYNVVNMQHPGTDSSLWEGKPGHPWDVIRATPIPRRVVFERFHDVPFVLDSLPGWAAQHADVGPIDEASVGMSGHSFGALTTQVMAGQQYPDDDRVLHGFREDRFRAGILYSPVPVKNADAAKLYGGIALPLLHMTGTQDDSPIETFGYADRRVIYDHVSAPGQSLFILDGGDHMVFTGSRGQLGENPKRKLQEALIKIIALAWWDAWLKDDGAARDWLNGSGIQNYLGAEGQFIQKPE